MDKNFTGITITYDQEMEQAHYQLHNIGYEQAQRILLAMAMQNHSFAVEGATGHVHIMDQNGVAPHEH